MSKTRAQKEETVASLSEKLGRAKSVVFVDYKGLTMSQMSDIRRQLSDQNAQFLVTKNTLLKLAFKNSDIRTPTSDNLTTGPTATLLSFEDEISPIKTLVKTLKDYSIGSVKGGLFEGELMDQYKIISLANLPSKDELRAKVVGSLGAPLYGILGVLQANLRNLVYALDQIRLVRGGEA